MLPVEHVWGEGVSLEIITFSTVLPLGAAPQEIQGLTIWFRFGPNLFVISNTGQTLCCNIISKLQVIKEMARPLAFTH